MVPIIGILGRGKAGKDTLADFLVRDHGFTKLAFADPMKRFLKDLFEFSSDQMWGDGKDVVDPRYGFEPRIPLQTLGTEWGRALLGDVWALYGMRVVDKLRAGQGMKGYLPSVGVFERFGEVHEPPRGFVFSDCRFPNEVTVIKRAGGFIVEIMRPGATPIGGVRGHESERAQSLVPECDIDFRIVNDGTLTDLRKKIVEIMEALWVVGIVRDRP